MIIALPRKLPNPRPGCKPQYGHTGGGGYPNFGQNMSVMTTNHQLGPSNHTKQSQNTLGAKSDHISSIKIKQARGVTLYIVRLFGVSDSTFSARAS